MMEQTSVTRLFSSLSLCAGIAFSSPIKCEIELAKWDVGGPGSKDARDCRL